MDPSRHPASGAIAAIEAEFSTESLRFMEDLAPALPGFVYIYDVVARRVVYANRRMALSLGYRDDETPALDAMVELLHPDDRRRLDDLMARWAHARDDEVLETHYRIRAASGEWRWFLARDRIYRRNADGSVRLIVGTTQDVTEARRVEHELMESRARFRRLSDAASEAIVIHDQGRIIDGNETLARMFGYDCEDMVGMDAFMLAAPESRAMLREKVRERYEDGYEAIGLRRDGTRFPIELIGKQIPYAGRTVRVVSIRDITERKQAEDELRSQAESQRLLRNELDHRVRNNLSSLLGLIDLAARTNADAPALANAMRRRVEAMATVHALLSRGEWRSLHLGKLLRAIVSGGHPGRTTLDGEELDIPANRIPALAMILNELTMNSLKHGALGVKGGRVELRWHRLERDGEPRLLLEWIERDGPLVSLPAQSGMGIDLIHGLMKSELRGRAVLMFPPEGAQHRLEIALAP